MRHYAEDDSRLRTRIRSSAAPPLPAPPGDELAVFEHVELKLAYFQGVLDGASVIEGARDS